MAAGLGFKTFTTGEVLTAADTNGYLMQGILVFASEAARNSAITSPQEGQFAFTKDTNSTWYYDGAAWVASGASGDVTGVTAGNGITVTSPTGPVPTVAIDTAITADLTTAQTLTNKKLSDSTTTIVDVSDATKAIKFDVAGTTAVTGTIATAFTTAKTVTIPDTTGTVALTNGVVNNTLTTTTGDIIYASAANTPARLGIGTTGQTLQVAGGIPSWASAAATGFVGVAATASASTINVGANTQHVLAFNTEDFDTDTFHNNVTNNSRITIPTGKGGKYLINIDFTNNVTCSYVYMYFLKNGSNTGLQTGPAEAYIATIVNVGTGQAKLRGSVVVSLAAADYIEVSFQGSDGATPMTYYARFSAVFLGA